MVDRMEKLKLVRREVSSDDKRRVEVSLSPKGQQLLEKLYLIHRAELGTRAPRLASLLRQAVAEIPGGSDSRGAGI
jgi:DNA-binding MarR family transcriptional regulator